MALAALVVLAALAAVAVRRLWRSGGYGDSGNSGGFDVLANVAIYLCRLLLWARDDKCNASGGPATALMVLDNIAIALAA